VERDGGSTVNESEGDKKGEERRRQGIGGREEGEEKDRREEEGECRRGGFRR